MANIYIDQFHTGMFQTCITGEAGESLYQVFMQNHIPMKQAVCRGAGVCRGCRVLIVEEGMECPACRYTIADKDIHVVMNQELPEQTILLTDSISEHAYIPSSIRQAGADKKEYGLAIDIGTTTIASALVETDSGSIVCRHGCMNRQIRYGADVISRIQYAITEHNGVSGLSELTQSIREDLEALIQAYTADGIADTQIRQVAISGNTTMLHFLLKLDVSGMAAYPFTPVRLDGLETKWQGKTIRLLPGKSAFVGSDVVAGIQALELGQSSEYDLLIDLGTNGELWLLNNERGVCTSTSCGPAFANSVRQEKAYGTTLLDALAEAYENKLLDADGLLQGEAFETGILCGEIVITQDTVRQLQLAKAAIRTGIELAAYELRLPLEQIHQVYLAGGFGFHLNPESAYRLGLLPDEFRGKLHIVGNTSLAGAVMALKKPEQLLTLSEKLKSDKYMDLSMNKNFQEFFIHRIGFPET